MGASLEHVGGAAYDDAPFDADFSDDGRRYKTANSKGEIHDAEGVEAKVAEVAVLHDL